MATTAAEPGLREAGLALPIGPPSGLLDTACTAVADALAAVADHADRLAPITSRPADLLAVLQLARQADALATHLIGHAESDGLAADYGLRRLGDLIEHLSNTPARQVAGRAATHHDLHQLPATDHAYTRGTISGEHVATIRRAHRQLGGLPPDTDTHLADLATGCTPAEFTGIVNTILEAYTGHDTPSDDTAYNRRYLTLSRRCGGTAIDGFLDPATGAALEALLAPHTSKTGDDDHRSHAQRTADALATVINHAAGATDAHPRSRVVITITTSEPPDRLPGYPPIPTPRPEGLTDTGYRLTGPSLDLLCCTADLDLLHTTTTGIPLNLGRTTRHATPAQKRALAARDHGCIHPACHTPARHCHAHHIQHWTHGGPTDLNNLALTCAYHHTQIHHGRLHIIEDPHHPGHYTTTHRKP